MTYQDIWKKHAILREGVVYNVYLDSLDKPTAGIGHLLTAQELKTLKVGDAVSKKQVDTWFTMDTQWATIAAKKQAKEIGIETDWFIAALISVNFQLGAKWTRVFKTTYPAIVNGNYDKAINNLRKSLWYKQTPVRVEDFIVALERAKTFKSRPLAKTRTMAGGSTATVSLIAAETVTEITEKIEPLTGYSETIQTAFVILALVGVALMVFARIDDRKKGHR